MIPSTSPKDGNNSGGAGNEDGGAKKRAYSTMSAENDGGSPLSGTPGSPRGSYRTRPIRSCTHCRQQKIKCDASDTFPGPCTRCSRMDRECRVDPYFKPQKGGQVQSLRDDLSSLRQQVEYLQQRENALEGAIAKTNPNHSLLADNHSNSNSPQSAATQNNSNPAYYRPGSIPPMTSNTRQPGQLPSNSGGSIPAASSPRPIDPLMGTATATAGIQRSASTGTPASMPISAMLDKNTNNSSASLGSASPTTPSMKKDHSYPHDDSKNDEGPKNGVGINRSTNSPKSITSTNTAITADNKSPDSPPPKEYVINDVRISPDRAEELHETFMTRFLPYLPIIQSNSARELYQQSELLFWTVCLTASLSEPEPSLYNSLSGVIKKLAIETCWIHTPRSTHIVQALIILANWPIPNEKVLDDSSYRFIGLARFLAKQLGLHRGKFIYEFSRTQVSLPDAEKWRTRTWLALFFSEQVWGANLGLPSDTQVDYLINNGQTDESLPPSFRSLLKLSIFYSKMVNLIGSSASSPDGLLEAKNRISTLGIMEQELENLIPYLDMQVASVEIYYLYIKLMICFFAFLPGTAEVDQAKYVVQAFHAGTRVITLISGLVEQRQIVEFPIYMRQAVSYAAFTLFRLHLSSMLPSNFVESARQSVVTVHRLYRNMLTAWKDVENDISRTAKVLEKLNFVIITHPYLFTQAPGIITRMRSHLTASLFYELIWAVHEARRRGTNNVVTNNINSQNNNLTNNAVTNSGKPGDVPQALVGPQPQPAEESVPPLPFYNQITKDDFTTNTTTTPNGTTITTLVPTHPNATLQVFNNNNNNNNSNNSSNSNNNPQNSAQNLPSNQYSPEASFNTPVANDASTAANATNAPQNPSDALPSNGTSNPQMGSGMAALLDSTGASNDPLHLDTLMQGIDWMNSENGDDFLGWMDINLN